MKIGINTIGCTVLMSAMLANTMSVFADTTWYFTGGNDTADNNRGILNPAKWKDASGNVATAFSAEDEYVVRNGRLRIAGQSFNGGPIHFGDLSQTDAMRRGGICQDNTSAGAAFPNGVYFDCGYYWVNIYKTPLPEEFRGVTLDASWINVRAPVEEPFVFYCQPAAMYNNRRVLVNAPLISDENAGIVVGPAMSAGGNYTACGTNFTVALVGDCSAYKGTISVTTAQEVAFGKWDVGLLLGDITVDGKVRLAAGTMIEAREGARNQYAGKTPAECTVGSLELAANSMIQVSGDTTTPTNGIIHVRDSLFVERPVALKLNYNARMPSTNEATRLTVLTAPSSSRLDARDFVFDIGTTSTAQYYDLIVEEDAATQTKSLVAVFGPTVKQTGHYGNDEGAKDKTAAYSSFTNAAYWSDSLLPHGNAHYYTKGHYLRTMVDSTLDYGFPGLSFTQIGGRFTILTKSFRVPEYIVRDATTVIWLGQEYNIEKTIKADRFTVKSGVLDLGAYNSQTFVIDGEIVGGGEIQLRGVSSTGALTGNYRFTGLNTNFTGSISIQQREGATNYSSPYQTLYVNDGRNLGGAKDAFDAKALMLDTYGRLAVTNGTVTLSAGLNRGLYAQHGRLHADAGCTLVVDWPVTMHGRLWKEGVGTLVLGGDVRFDSADGMPETDMNRLTVVAGAVKPAVHNALDGLLAKFYDGSSLVLAINPENADMMKYGILNAKTTTPFGLDTLTRLPLSVDVSAHPVIDEAEYSFGLLTVTNVVETVASVREMLPNVKPYAGIHQEIVERENAGEGTVTFVLKAKHIGTRLIFR